MTNQAIDGEFYRRSIELMNQNHVQYLVGGAFAFKEYTGIFRYTKDLDIFCRPDEYEKILKLFSAKGYAFEVTDVRWIAKVFHGDQFLDLIFNSPNNICPVEDSWFEWSLQGELFGQPVRFVAPEEMIWSKMFVQDRERFDGSDVNHIILKQGKNIDWHRLNRRMSQHWQILLAHVASFQYVYPSRRDAIPEWLVKELGLKMIDQYQLPATIDLVCRGPYLDNKQYEVDIKEWGYKSVTCETV